MIKIELPKPLDCMSSEENRQYARALNELSQAYADENHARVDEILNEFALTVCDDGSKEGRASNG